MFNLDQLNSSIPTYIIFGLGNPGPEYKNTRHNAGFWCVEFLAEKYGFPAFSRNNKNVMISTGIIAGTVVALAKPRTFVNNSGHAIETGLKKFHVGIDDILIVSDDITLRDWENNASGKTEVLNVNKKIFNNVESINVVPVNLYKNENKIIAELEIIINGKEKILVVDIISFNNDGKIKSIKAFKC